MRFFSRRQKPPQKSSARVADTKPAALAEQHRSPTQFRERTRPVRRSRGGVGTARARCPKSSGTLKPHHNLAAPRIVSGLAGALADRDIVPTLAAGFLA